MVVAVVALVIAASGSAVAATKLVSGDGLIKKRSLSGNRLKNHSVTGKQIKISSLGKVPSAANADNATNAITATTAKASPIAQVTYVSTPAIVPVSTGAPGETATPETATCPAGTTVLGGGTSITDKTGDSGLFVFDSYPNGKTGWTAEFFNSGSGPSGTAPSSATVYAICAPAATTAP